MVYFIQALGGGPIKIGTTVRLTQRLRDLAREAGEEHRVLAVVSGSYKEENELHRRFSSHRTQYQVFETSDEWFQPVDDILGFIIEMGPKWDGSDESPLGEAVRIRTEVAAKARIAAAFAGETISEYLSEILDPILTKAINEGHARMNKASSTKPKRQQSSE